MSERLFPPRKEIRAKLRELGMSHRQIDALIRPGWRDLIGESQAEIEEAQEAKEREQLEALRLLNNAAERLK